MLVSPFGAVADVARPAVAAIFAVACTAATEVAVDLGRLSAADATSCVAGGGEDSMEPLRAGEIGIPPERFVGDELGIFCAVGSFEPAS